MSIYKDYYEEHVNDKDFIKVVRCKDCIHWSDEFHWCNIRDSFGWDYKPDDYCSYGERIGEINE